ncbi:MAG: PQQ-binding-like beta-propeller repeat protein [Actinobacteria bacterium]|nr:PQQ-binding-like beta-propeller repeat protein [Actinomycetota bacterium]
MDGDIYAQPLVVGNEVIAATEGNTVYALDAASGRQIWKAALGEPVRGSDLPCGNIDPSGITGTPVADTSSGTLYAVAFLRSSMQHELFALDLQTGSVRWHRPVDPPGLSPLVEQERGALALSGGRVYVPFGGLYGDCGQYKGAVVSVAADGSGDLGSYIVPTSRMGGLWNPGGPAVDGNGDLWVITGNSQSQGTFDFGNAVIRLSPQLKVQDYFAPSDWVNLNAGDLDLSSMNMVLVGENRVLAVGKTGTAYLLDAGNLGKVGGALSSTDVGSSAFGVAATMGSAVLVPCTNALIGLSVTGDKIEVVWKVSGRSASPIVAAGLVWSMGGDGVLKAVDPQNGGVKFSTKLDRPVTQFTSPSAAGGRLFVAVGPKIVAFTLH